MTLKHALLGLAAAAALVASAQAPAAAADKLPVVASFSILADLVGEVGGDRVDVVSLVPVNGDAHVFEPTPQDAKNVAGAKLIFENGLGLEGWMDRLIKQAGAKATIVVASTGVTPRHRTKDEPQDEDEGSASGSGGPIDPHAWQSVKNAEIYVKNIRDALVKADPADKAYFDANAKAYLVQLAALDAEIRTAMAKIPAEHRRIVTSHDAFGYFGDAYGLKLLAPQGFSTEEEPSAQDVANLIRQIKADKIPAVFIENMTNPTLIQQVASESGAKVGGELFSDALSDPSGPAPTYVDMMRSNVKELSAALGG